MTCTAKTVALTIHLEAAHSCISKQDFSAGMLALKNALQIANAEGRNDIKKLIFRAMNVIRPKLRG